jgi:hypothetical protein
MADQDPAREPSRLLSSLLAAGFDVRFERGAWVTCLVAEESASWPGRGVDDEAALTDALRHMVPSPTLRARVLAAWSADARGSGGAHVAPAGAGAEPGERHEPRSEGDQDRGAGDPTIPGASDLDGSAPGRVHRAADGGRRVADGDRRAPDGGRRVDDGDRRAPERDRTEHGSGPPAGGAGASAPAGDPADLAPPPPRESPRAHPEAELRSLDVPRPPASGPPLSRAEMLDHADALLGDARAMHGEVAQLARRPMRLTLLGWIAAGRALQDGAQGDREVARLVGELAGEIRGYTKRYWPGSVPALQLHASPRSCLAQLGAGDAPQSWQEVAERAERAARDEEGRSGTDDDGWADAASLRPRPRAPEALLDEVVGRLRKIAQAAGPRGVPPTALAAGSTLGAELVDAARKLRWLRGVVLRQERWGEAMGALRRIADRAGYEGSPLAQVLDEGYQPPSGSWARELGQDPEAKERRRARRDLLRGRPGADASPEEMRAWLAQAVDALSTPELGAVLHEQAATVAAIPAEAMDGRRSRARLKKLQSLLASGVRDAERERAMRAELDAVDGGADDERDERDERDEIAPVGPDPEEELRWSILPSVRGKRLLGVSNRADPNLVAALEQGLEPASIDWLIAEPRRESAYAARIASGRYDLVLCATGFVSHSTEHVLRSACRGAGIPYVRTNKGRLSACLRALGRDLGILV